jgi:dUTP pyrophosphatase
MISKDAPHDMDKMNHWYELELVRTNPSIHAYYTGDIINRSDVNAGWDLHAAEEVIVEQTPQFIPFGIIVRMLKVEPMPHGTSNDYLKTDSHFFLVPRSSIYKTGLLMANSPGIIDKSYRGELKAPVWSMTGHSQVNQGDRMFQIVAPDMGWIRTIRIVESHPETERGAGGFGSTGI